MHTQLQYYSNGDGLFRVGELIFINKASEEPEAHLHAHDFIEIAYVASGHGIHIMEDSRHEVSKGDIFIINYNTPHEFRSLTEDPSQQLVIYNCVFKPEVLDESLKNTKDFHAVTKHLLFRSFFSEDNHENADIRIQGNTGYAIAFLYEKMYHEYLSQQKGYQEMLKAYVIELLIMIFRHYDASIKEEPAEIKQRDMVEKIVQYVKDHYSEGFKLEDISLATFLNEKQLCDIFKKYTGMTIIEFSQKVRVEEACDLLRNTDRKVIDIALEVGYSDIKFFNQVFKRIVGQTPSEYRKCR